MAATDVVLDASALLACWLPETAEANRYARAVLEAAREGAVFHAPQIFEVEIGAGLMRALRSRRIDLETMRSALAEIEDVAVALHHYPYTARILIDIAMRHHVQISDGLYLHLAQVYELPLATLDGGLRTAARSHGVKLFEPAS